MYLHRWVVRHNFLLAYLYIMSYKIYIKCNLVKHNAILGLELTAFLTLLFRLCIISATPSLHDFISVLHRHSMCLMFSRSLLIPL